MHLVTVAVDTPGWQAEVGQLRRALKDNTAETDRLQHAYLEAGEGQITFSLYLQAVDREEAVQLANQLARRTMATISASQQHWSVSTTQALQ